MDTIQSRILECYNILEKYDLGNLLEEFQDEILHAGYLIAILDGELDKAEYETLNSFFKTRYQPDTLRDTYHEKIDDKDSFLNKIPEIIKQIAEREKKANFGIQAILYDTREFFYAFKLMGSIMITCNGKRMKIQINALDQFLRKIIYYVLEVENRLDVLKNPDYHETDEPEEKKALPANSKPTISENSLENEELLTLMEEIDAMVGLEPVKKEIHNLVNLMRMRVLRKAKGLEIPNISMHLVFTGNPGTGKTIMARKIAQIYKCLGILSTGVFVETERSGLVAGYMGQTAEQVRKKVEEAKGGVLFIDEAYTLSNSGNEGDYGQEAIDTLLKFMEDLREDFVLIVAGYPREMEQFLKSNPGLKSRFNKYIYFDDYSAEELYQIFLQLCKKNDYVLDNAAEDSLLYIITDMVAKKGREFANARDIRNYFEKVITNQANRVMEECISDTEQLVQIKMKDLMME